MTEENPKGQGDDLIVIYKADDQFIAEIIKGLLEGEGIPVILESKQVAWLDGVMKMAEGYWGDVVVPQKFVERAKELIDAYHRELEESQANEN